MFNQNSSKKHIELDRFYICPICRNGNISGMPLMQQAFACDSCNHIFAPEFDRQVIKSIDLQTPVFWRWNGKHWRIIKHQKKFESIYSGFFC
jgi:hypothetical protein